ncbi:Kinetochore-associated protein 1 [Cyphomyrmex costatus]|uniref:Kinetochore-associated protein 1 n=1 Tax=Cyphomyrmex costatus TaxID=456900 RepID=A0A195D247_9HYME|nr:Kinetochore-associated protein 1 [Cyphomyrmex costatus]
MALWNSVQSGFNVDDETVNFGPRIITESNGSLHEACTVATIQSLEKVDQQPNVIASIQYSKICVAIDKSITVFNDETCDEILYNISFPSMIVSYCISKDDFEQKLEMNVSTNIHLFKCLHTSDNLFYIEGIATNNETGIIDTFRIKTILKSIPEIRLAKLLKKRQFDAAEAFAEKFNLSMESIYYSKAALFVEQLSPWTKSTPNSVNVDTLINILNKIQNVQYVIECCNKALISDYIQMRRIYLYARERIMQNIKIKNIDDSLNTSLSIINDALYRLETFHMIQDTEADTLLNDDASMKEWIQFSQANLLEECTTRLNMGQLKSATLIWTRHLPDLVKHISIQTVQNIFTILPEDVDLSCLWLWLIHFIPTLLSLLPDAINEIMSWSLKKLKYLEIFHHTVWPEIGIEFAKKFMKLLKFEDNQLVYFHQEYRYQNSLLKQFMVLFQALTDIQQLKIVHRLKVPVDLYIDSPVEAIYMLLDKIHLDQISNFINTFLKQYIFNNNLQNDTVFCTYIQKTIKNSYSWWFNEEATWEKRVAIIISLIHNIEKRLEQTLIVLRKAPVPWSSTIATLAETGINYDHSLSFKIKIECDYVPTKLILKKYGYATIGRLISRIIKENYDSMINDIDVLTKDNQQLKQDAFCQCINARLNEKNPQKAMDVLHYLENNIASVLYCCEGIINYIIAAFSFQNATTSLIHHMEILGCLEFKICNLLTQSNVCPYRCNNIIKTIKDLKSLYALKKHYDIDISLKDYHMQKSFVLQNYISKLLSNIKENDWSVMHKTIIKVAELLGLEKSYATLSMLEQMKNLTNLNELEHLIDDDDLCSNIMSKKFENILKICLLILQHSTVDTNVVKVVKSLSISVLNTCQDNDLQSALMVYTCANVCPNFPIQECFDTKQRLVPQSNWKLYTIYKDQAIFLDENLLLLFKDAMSLHLYYSNQININTNCNEEMDQLLSNFLENTKKMQPQHNDYSLLQIFKTFYFMYYGTSIRNEERLTEMKCILSQLLINLLRKLCTGRSFDLQLGLSALFMLSEQEACDWLHTISASFQADHIRHCTISTLGYEYSRLGQNRSLIQTFENHKLLHIWAQRLSDYSINPKEVLMNSALNKKELLQQIISSNKENMISLLKDYCCSFGFNFNDCLLLYLQVLLKTWNPTLTISNINVNKELLICKEEVDELRKKCNAIVAQMQDISMLKQCMSTLWQHITFYHYEVFIILMDLIEDKDIEKRNYLCFLQNYTRSGPPTSMEHNEWIQLNPGHSTLPAIAQWRLPFLLKVDIWKIITPELNLKTYDKWLDIAPVLNLEAHLICSLAIKGEMEKVWANNSITSKNTTWSLYSKNTTLLKDSKKCIQQLTDSDGFYYGTAALYYIVNYTPPGADRVAAAKECYEYAQLAAQNSTKFKEGKELEKIKFKYLTFTSEHILRTYGLEKDEYLALIEYPYKLVYALYNDKSIPLRYRTATKYKPDINAAVNELGKLFSLNTIKLRMDLLEEWLQSNAKYTELSQSFTETFIVSKESDQNTDCEDNLLRICYILEYGDMDLFAQFLINIGFGNRHGDTEYSYNVRYRVFQILQTVVDIPTLEKLTKQDICTFRKYMKSLQYIGKLESLGLCYSIDSFETCCKRELVQILWSSQRHVSYALSVIAQICIEFEINDILFWDDTLTQMRKLRMVIMIIIDLKKVLLQLRDKNVIVNCNGYKTGWQLIISEPFSKMDINPNLEQIDNCIEAVCLLYSCPVTHELDFTAIVRDCFQSQQAHLAAALLPFLNDVENKFVLETINQKCQIEKLIEDLNHLSSRGVLTITHSLAMVQKSIP